MTNLDKLRDAVIEGDGDRIRELVQAALREGTAPLFIIQEGLIPGMDLVGARFRAGEMFVPEVLVAAQAMQAALQILRPLLKNTESSSAGIVVLGTVKEDIHDIGKNLVRMLLEGAGFAVIDLGKNVPEQAFVDAVRKHQPDVLGLSCLLTTTMKWMRSTIETIETSGLRDRVKVLVGGAPITQKFADEIGADAYAPDATTAVDRARALIRDMGQSRP